MILQKNNIKKNTKYVLNNYDINRHWLHAHLLKRQHNYTQKNESENSTNQQHETLKRYLAQSTQWRHIMFSKAENKQSCLNE